MYEELLLNLFLYGVFSFLFSLLWYLFVSKYTLSDAKIMDKIDLVLSNMVNDVEMQKKVYLLGTLLGSGIAKGSGIQGSGKFKLEDVITQGASAFIGNMFKQPSQREQTQGALP